MSFAFTGRAIMYTARLKFYYTHLRTSLTIRAHTQL